MSAILRTARDIVTLCMIITGTEFGLFLPVLSQFQPSIATQRTHVHVRNRNTNMAAIIHILYSSTS